MTDVIKNLKDTYEVSLPYRYLVFFGMSEKRIGITEEIAGELNWKEVVEYRCFDEAGEVHGIMQPADNRRLIHITDQEATEEEKDVYLLQNTFEDSITAEYPLIRPVRLSETDGQMTDTLILKRYINYDEDGQGTIVASRCYGFTNRKGI